MSDYEYHSTTGHVHWEGLTVNASDGEISLRIPAEFEREHVPFLRAILTDRVGELLSAGTTVSASAGAIYIEGPFTEAFPNARPLRDALQSAVHDAGAAEAALRRRADRLRSYLSGGG
jgi:hypothetical protein